MDTNFVVLAPMEEQDLPLEWTRDHLLTAAKRYIALQDKARELLPMADDSLLSGTPGTVYLKKMNHRPLSGEDSDKIIRALGSDEDKIALATFTQAQQALSERLKKTKGIGLIMEQAAVPYLKQRRRIANPAMWKAEEMISVVETLKRLQL
jgi:hypothetical protein